MKMDGNLRVRISKEYEQVYNSLKSIGIESHTLFFVCFCIAVAKDLEPKPLKSKVDRFWSRTFDPEEWVSMYSVILDKNGNNLKTIENDEDVIRQVELMANAGIVDFLENLSQDCIRMNGDVLSIAVDDKGEIVKDILYSLLETYFEDDSQ